MPAGEVTIGCARMQLMEGYWLKDRAFAAGNAISLADLLWICELEQLQSLQGAEQV